MTVTTIDSRQLAQPSTALAIRPGQTDWDKYQAAALAQIGLKDASDADRAVFLHQCQRTGLDPFSRQIYMIGRNEKVPGTQNQWRVKWTIQTGIDGWRVIRDRAEKRAGVRGILGRAIWYDHDGSEFKVWVRHEPPAGCEITYTVRDATGETPYTSVLQFDGYVQTNKDGQPIAQWAVKPAHMLEKCTEADVYRKAFPQDFAGVTLDDAMPPPEDMPAATGGRVTAADIRGRTRPQARGEIVHEPADASPADRPSPADTATPPADQPAGEAPARQQRRGKPAASPAAGVIMHFERLGITDRDERLAWTGKLSGYGPGLASTNDLSDEQRAAVLDKLSRVRDLAELLAVANQDEAAGDA